MTVWEQTELGKVIPHPQGDDCDHDYQPKGDHEVCIKCGAMRPEKVVRLSD